MPCSLHLPHSEVHVMGSTWVGVKQGEGESGPHSVKTGMFGGVSVCGPHLPTTTTGFFLQNLRHEDASEDEV